MSTRTLRRFHPGSTAELPNQQTRPLGDTGLLISDQPAEQLLVQVNKLLAASDNLTARFDAVSDVAIAVNSSLRPDDIVSVIVDKAQASLGFDYCGLALLPQSEDHKEYVLKPLVWPSGSESPGPQTFDQSDGLPATVLSSGKPLTVMDLGARPLKMRPPQVLALVHPGLEGRLSSAGVRSLLLLPLKANRRILGYLAFGKREPDYYSPDDLQLAYLFSSMLATALHNSRLFDAEVRRAHQLQMLNEIGQTATSILDSSTLLSKVPALVRGAFGYDAAKIGLLEGDEIVYAPNAQSIHGLSHPQELRLKVPANGTAQGIVALAAYTGQMVHVPNVLEDPRWSDILASLSSPHMRSVLVIPVQARDKVQGVLHFESKRIGAFSQADVSILRSLANQLGVALDNARLYSQLNELFHGYLAPQVASTLLDDPQNAQLGGQRRDVTVLFADLSGFTGLSERIPPEELLELLNACLGVATDAILEYGGTIDKYMGDAVMALFNAPQDQPDHAWRAMRAAVAMQRGLCEHSRKWSHKLRLSIGINTGEAVVGNIGSPSLRNFTAIGDTVNLAKRIQELAGPDQILLSQSTYELALATAEASGTKDNDSIVSYRIGTTHLKGRSKPAVLYELNPYAEPLANTRQLREDEVSG